MFFRCGTKMSFSAVRKPHMKNSVVAIAIALLSVEAGAVVTIGDCGVAIAISSEPRFCFDRHLSKCFQRAQQRLRQRKNYNRQACREAVSKQGDTTYLINAAQRLLL